MGGWACARGETGAEELASPARELRAVGSRRAPKSMKDGIDKSCIDASRLSSAPRPLYVLARRRSRIPTPPPDLNSACTICEAEPVSGNAKSAKRKWYALWIICVCARIARKRAAWQRALGTQTASPQSTPPSMPAAYPTGVHTGIEGVISASNWPGRAL